MGNNRSNRIDALWIFDALAPGKLMGGTLSQGLQHFTYCAYQQTSNIEQTTKFKSVICREGGRNMVDNKQPFKDCSYSNEFFRNNTSCRVAAILITACT